MEILAFGVQADERPLLERAFDGHHQIRCLDVLLNRDTAPIAAGYEIITVGVDADLSAEVLQELAAGGTKMIAQRATGHRTIDLCAAADLGLTIGRVARSSPHSAAEFAWCLALAVDRRLVRGARRTRDADLRLDGLMGRDLHGRTAGVLGTGRTGAAFARIAHGFGMRLLGWDAVENPACTELGMTYTGKEELLAESDLVSLHVPLVESTRHLIDAAALAAMKDDAVLVNTGRDGLVDTAALVATLAAGRLRGVALDGVPDDTLARLMPFPNALLTADQAYFTEDAVGQVIDTTVRNIEDYLAGRAGENLLVTPEGRLTPERQPAAGR
ncbi:NAD(P)-dependent oxidoreductase [Streptomyces sp. NPDC050315]|uniref:NAD(P)-dependent oxidoreductase n=1 Tax=Streptomyces sp. NPDC050315 TaxID=3155039 RepID=UPI003440D156